ncbi:MAG: hypothetical protein D6818_06540 [Bacteroidetes bacterium]|nr:MAG: hypothetical protein D6818_06540 [Bacteroidota bacterium]
MLFGYDRARMPVFRNHNFMLKVADNPWATPLVYTESPLLAGYISEYNLKHLGGTAAAIVCGQGGGKVIAFTDNPCFRAFWYGTNKLLANAIFFGQVISSRAVER